MGGILRDGNQGNHKRLDNYKRLVEILLPYGTVETQEERGEWQPLATPQLDKNRWIVPIDEWRWLSVEVSAMPGAMADLLELYVSTLESAGDGDEDVARQRLIAWLGGDASVNSVQLGEALLNLRWSFEGAIYLLIEFAKETDEQAVADALQLLGELVDEGRAFLTVQPLTQRVAMLWAPLLGEEPEQEVSAWLQTLSAELFLFCRAGLSRSIGSGSDVERAAEMVANEMAAEATLEGAALAVRLQEARAEAEFALLAGKRFRSQEFVHGFGRLGLARVLHGLPKEIRDEFLAEVLAADVAATLTQELRETVFAFWEHSMQVADTARSLFVHRNTLLYRLERIVELTGYDIRRPMHLWTLWLALTWLRSN